MLIGKGTRHYLEVFYNYNPDRGTKDDFTSLHVITDRNPLLYIEKYNGAIGFRFFDMDICDYPLNKEKRKKKKYKPYILLWKIYDRTRSRTSS